MKALMPVAGLLVIIGALNWGLVGLVGLNVVNTIFGGMPTVERIVYILVGLSAVVVAWNMYGGKK
ncbi:DUF378 domain-containing protein [Candidatus Daviesbacteria bacterium]|nr:DUF378 domain-containing protein [Candidatus Daviesbacteria bacterium]